MVQLFNFHPSHLHLAKGIGWSPDVLSGIVDRVGDKDWIVLSCVSRGILQAVFAGKRIQVGVFECLMLPCEGFGNISLHKGAIAAMEYAHKTFGIHRFQATVECGFEKGIEWLKRLGFKQEGILKDYDSITRKDHEIYGRVM